MTILPPRTALQVLLELSDAIGDRAGWAPLAVVDSALPAGMTETQVDEIVSTLTTYGYCIQAASGRLVYVTEPAARLCNAVRQLLRRGGSICSITEDQLTTFLYPGLEE